MRLRVLSASHTLHMRTEQKERPDEGQEGWHVIPHGSVQKRCLQSCRWLQQVLQHLLHSAHRKTAIQELSPVRLCITCPEDLQDVPNTAHGVPHEPTRAPASVRGNTSTKKGQNQCRHVERWPKPSEMIRIANVTQKFQQIRLHQRTHPQLDLFTHGQAMGKLCRSCKTNKLPARQHHLQHTKLHNAGPHTFSRKPNHTTLHGVFFRIAWVDEQNGTPTATH
mmetsp:Transcript_2285/g.6583  ORF Transcript_2285/g.6583 Transcript_2285/m.6583 type:complete len:222 (+) Transcript_2285:894-1559(+)